MRRFMKALRELSSGRRRMLLLMGDRGRRIDQIIDYFGGLAPAVACARGVIARPMAAPSRLSSSSDSPGRRRGSPR